MNSKQPVIEWRKLALAKGSACLARAIRRRRLPITARPSQHSMPSGPWEPLLCQPLKGIVIAFDRGGNEVVRVVQTTVILCTHPSLAPSKCLLDLTYGCFLKTPHSQTHQLHTSISRIYVQDFCAACCFHIVVAAASAEPRKFHYLNLNRSAVRMRRSDGFVQEMEH